MTDAPAHRLLRWQDAPPQPWRNGGGLTRELLAWPEGGAWQCRISVADIVRSGPFSAFPGATRWFAVLDGEGVVLGLPSGPGTLRPGEAACRFDGGDAPECDLLGGPTRDLNLMLRGAAGRMEPVAAATPWRPAASQAGVFTRVDGRVDTGHGAAVAVPAMSLCWWAEAPASLAFHAELPAPAGGFGWWIAVTPQPSGDTP